MTRGEKPIELGNSWFSAKSIEVERILEKEGVEHSLGKGGPKPYRIQGNSKYLFFKIYRQTLGAKVQSREGNSPDRTLRFQSNILVLKEVFKLRQPGSRLGSSHLIMKA